MYKFEEIVVCVNVSFTLIYPCIRMWNKYIYVHFTYKNNDLVDLIGA